MNYKKAAAELRYQLYEESHCTYIEDEIVMAIKALESMPEYERLIGRDTPTEPDRDWNESGSWAECPECGAGLDEGDSYCRACGQAIRWVDPTDDWRGDECKLN